MIRQLDGPGDTHSRPSDRFVANFIGQTNELEIRACDASGPCADAVTQTTLGPMRGAVHAPTGGRQVAVWRPEAGVLSADEPGTPNRWQRTVDRAIDYGSQIEFTVKVGDRLFRVTSHNGRVFPVGSPAWLSVEPRDIQFIADR